MSCHILLFKLSHFFQLCVMFWSRHTPTILHAYLTCFVTVGIISHYKLAVECVKEAGMEGFIFFGVALHWGNVGLRIYGDLTFPLIILQQQHQITAVCILAIVRAGLYSFIVWTVPIFLNLISIFVLKELTVDRGPVLGSPQRRSPYSAKYSWPLMKYLTDWALKRLYCC